MSITRTSQLFHAPPGHFALRLATGKTAMFLCEADSRASFILYVPSKHNVCQRARGEDVTIDCPDPMPLVVLIHGASRNAHRLRDQWSEAAEKNNFIVLCPIFPCDVLYPGVMDYRFVLSESGLRTDDLLLDMIDTVKRDWGGVVTDTFCLAGYSGGGQFAHRFFYVHPNRVQAIAIGAPGTSTTLTDEPWPAGISDFSQVFGVDIDFAALASTPIQLAVGSADTQDVIVNDGSTMHISRPDLITDLAASFSAKGVPYEMVVKEGIRHSEVKMQDVMETFIVRHLR